MSSHKGKESTNTRKRCSAKRLDGKQCPGDGQYDGSTGKICGACYNKIRGRTTVGNIASSFKAQEYSSNRSSPSIRPQPFTDQKRADRRTKTETQSYNDGASRNKGKRRASKTPSSGQRTPEYVPVSPGTTAIGTSEGLDWSPSLQTPAYGQRSYPVEYESYKPPQPQHHTVSPDLTGTRSPGFQTSRYGQQGDPVEFESYQTSYHPRSPDVRGFAIPETEIAPRAYATQVVEQPFTQSVDGQHTQYANRNCDEGDLYSANTPPNEIWQSSSLTSAYPRRTPVGNSQDPGHPRRIRQWESGYSRERDGGSISHHSTTPAGGESSLVFNPMPTVSNIQSQMCSTSIEGQNIVTTSDIRGSYHQMPSKSNAPLDPGAGPSFPPLPEVAQGVIKDKRWEIESRQWELNKIQMQRLYLDQYPASDSVSEGPEEFRAHLLFAMSLGEGLRCNTRDSNRHRCENSTVPGKRYFYCDIKNHNDQNNPKWYRGMLRKTPKRGECFQVMESSNGVKCPTRRQCGCKTKETYCGLEYHCEKYLNVPQPR
ncbi:uncharacterized protein EAE98_009959 [Botrytis deweyae]|uniref:Zn(2)-C6 fungal-type domain-containing protein n=1 Tax=Botrytis deweyae TaxID=2478750 RepID=A0ABQ7IA25_9HELO|nr:uncharacterized protein EAE98_009959 [Botrytis deweyae]KAF7917931.1 hypothetical protein EAE98_009959 [Botrytis deweyae]